MEGSKVVKCTHLLRERVNCPFSLQKEIDFEVDSAFPKRENVIAHVGHAAGQLKCIPSGLAENPMEPSTPFPGRPFRGSNINKYYFKGPLTFGTRLERLRSLNFLCYTKEWGSS